MDAKVQQISKALFGFFKRIFIQVGFNFDGFTLENPCRACIILNYNELYKWFCSSILKIFYGYKENNQVICGRYMKLEIQNN